MVRTSVVFNNAIIKKTKSSALKSLQYFENYLYPLHPCYYEENCFLLPAKSKISDAFDIPVEYDTRIPLLSNNKEVEHDIRTTDTILLFDVILCPCNSVPLYVPFVTLPS